MHVLSNDTLHQDLVSCGSGLLYILNNQLYIMCYLHHANMSNFRNTMEDPVVDEWLD